MTHERAPARRDPGGRHGDGPGAFPSEQHLPPLHSGPWRPACWAGFVLWIWGSWCSWECLQREESGQSEVGLTTGARAPVVRCRCCCCWCSEACGCWQEVVVSSIHHGGVRVHSSIHDSSVTSHNEPQRISDARRQRRVRVGDNKEHQATCGTFSTYITPRRPERRYRR